ncbi:hypothetical protein D915_010384 [Fasciola hepatica]|uniref:Uncharacterized protein n=1 Tax=Fasciola hepatica TaxID=6192 RepID=A0A4E0QZH2_FASHE|nr:hypothetical protein D915_010384 [Fasciola hepatica]
MDSFTWNPLQGGRGQVSDPTDGLRRSRILLARRPKKRESRPAQSEPHWVGSCSDLSKLPTVISRKNPAQVRQRVSRHSLNGDLQSIEVSQALSAVENSTLTTNGHIEVPIRWKSRPMDLLDNYTMSLLTLSGLKKKFDRNPVLDKSYIQVIQHHIDNGYFELVKDDLLTDGEALK